MEYVTEQFQIIGIVALAMALGAVVGLNREFADKPAGLRTHTLVAGASALLVEIGGWLVRNDARLLASEMLRSDPLRLVEAVVTGVAFLGAGTIIRDRSRHVEGLTTAASLLFVAIIGVAVASRQIVAAAGCTILALAVLMLARFVGHEPSREE